MELLGLVSAHFGLDPLRDALNAVIGGAHRDGPDLALDSRKRLEKEAGAGHAGPS